MEEKATMSTHTADDLACLKARLRRYLPYLGVYAADVRTAIGVIEDLERNNATLVVLAKTATQDAAAEVLRLIVREQAI